MDELEVVKLARDWLVMSNQHGQDNRLARAVIEQHEVLTKLRAGLVEALDLADDHIKSRIKIIDGIAAMASNDASVKAARALFVDDLLKTQHLRKLVP